VEPAALVDRVGNSLKALNDGHPTYPAETGFVAPVVNAVAPGPTDTGMLTRFTGTAENKAALVRQVPLDRLGLSEEVADGIAFIASSDGAKWMTGEILNVDGGMTAN
jgi:NAD(P)-dependent dehydrogenase (short-subunit alcohol dehydrogenase family)